MRLRELVSKPLWYEEVFRRSKRVVPWMDDEMDALLQEGVVALGVHGPDWDAERNAIDTIVLHHTSRSPGLTASYLDAMHLLRVYASYYNDPSDADRQHVHGREIYSGHFRKGRQVFRAYHWIIRSTGSAERLLEDHEIGWHAGDWDVNCRSIAICVDDDLTHQAPTKTTLAGIADLVARQYSFVTISPGSLLGHREVNPRTICPGKRFLPSWKQDLLGLLKS